MNQLMLQATGNRTVGWNKSSQFRHKAYVTLLPEQREALFRPTWRLSAAARVVGIATLLLVGCNTSAPTTIAPDNPSVESSSLEEVTLYLPGMNESLQIL